MCNLDRLFARTCQPCAARHAHTVILAFHHNRVNKHQVGRCRFAATGNISATRAARILADEPSLKGNGPCSGRCDQHVHGLEALLVIPVPTIVESVDGVVADADFENDRGTCKEPVKHACGSPAHLMKLWTAGLWALRLGEVSNHFSAERDMFALPDPLQGMRDGIGKLRSGVCP